MAKRKNPGKGSFARCVESVSKRGGAYDPNAVCAAERRRTAKGARELEAASRRARKPNRNAATPHGTTYKFYPITLNDYGYYIVPKIDKDTWFDTIPEAKKHIDWWEKRKRNPSEAYRAGVSAMKSAAARHGTTNLTPSIAQREEWRHAWGEFMKGWKAEAKRPNPAAEASEAYNGFHGRPSEELVKWRKPDSLSQVTWPACGELRKLKFKPVGSYLPLRSRVSKRRSSRSTKPDPIVHRGWGSDSRPEAIWNFDGHEIETLGEVNVSSTSPQRSSRIGRR